LGSGECNLPVAKAKAGAYIIKASKRSCKKSTIHVKNGPTLVDDLAVVFIMGVCVLASGTEGTQQQQQQQ